MDQTKLAEFYDSAMITIGQASYGSIALGILAFLILHLYTRTARDRQHRNDVRSQSATAPMVNTTGDSATKSE